MVVEPRIGNAHWPTVARAVVGMFLCQMAVVGFGAAAHASSRTPVRPTVPVQADYRVQWSTSEGGPASALAALDRLGHDAGTRARYRVSLTAPPAEARAQPAAAGVPNPECEIDVLRLQSRDDTLTVEEWQGAAGERFIAVSMRGPDDPGTRAAFHKRVVRKLVRAGAHPMGDRASPPICACGPVARSTFASATQCAAPSSAFTRQGLRVPPRAHEQLRRSARMPGSRT